MEAMSIVPGCEDTVLSLPKGTLRKPGMPKIGGDYQPNDDTVRAAARVIAKHDDATLFKVQAGIVDHARRRYGFNG